MYSFPFNSSTALLYWNKDSFQKIGKSEAPKTWEEAEADMKALKAAGYDCPLAFDISSTIAPDGWLGTLLKGVLNFQPDPTVLQVVVWCAYLIPTLALFLAPAGLLSRRGEAVGVSSSR